MRRGAPGIWLSAVCALGLFLPTRTARAQEPAAISDHQLILRERVGWQLSYRSFEDVGGIVMLGMGNALAGLVVASNAGTAETATALAGIGALDALAITSAFLPRDDRSRILQTYTVAVPFVVYTILAMTGDQPRLTFGSVAAGYGVSTLLYGIDNFGRRTHFSTLQADHERLESRPMSSTELATVHRHMLGMRGPIPAWLRGLPLLAGGIVGFIPVFDERHSQDERRWAGILGGLSILNGGVMMLDDRVAPYERDLERVGITVEAAGTGLRVRGSFNAL